MNHSKKKTESDGYKLDQVILGVAVGVLVASMIISVITFYSVKEINETTRDTLQLVQEKIIELEDVNTK
ncbi:MAG: hypothetical protein ACE5DX_01130 [Candidatus Dojkabacteria bacterium]